MVRGMFFLVGVFGVVASLSAAEIKDTGWFRPANASSAIYRGQIDLPGPGIWQVRSVSDPKQLQVYAIPSDEARQVQVGKRMQLVVRERMTAKGRWKVAAVYRPALDFARLNNGIGPNTVDQLDAEQYPIISNLDKSPWISERMPEKLSRLEGPFLFMIPKARFKLSRVEGRAIDPAIGQVPAERNPEQVPPAIRPARPREWVDVKDREVLAFELRPYVDDGLHWVCYTDGQCRREKIDKDLVKQHGMKIRPITAESATSEGEGVFSYTLLALRPVDRKGPVTVALYNPVQGKEQQVNWSFAKSAKDSAVVDSLNQARQLAWSPYLASGPAPILKAWASNIDLDPSDVMPRQNRRGGNRTNMFSVLGGRAAVEETLQLQNLNVVPKNQKATVKLASIEGVKVKAHPFEEMLAGAEGGDLQLAQVVPEDRFMVYVAKPSAILPLLDHGASFLASTGASLTQNKLHYNLAERYFDRLGMNREWLESVLGSGLISEMVVVAPDLFFIDGTDLTVVSRLQQPAILKRLLSFIGLADLGETGVLTRGGSNGRPSYWALRGDLLFVSSNRNELAASLDLLERDGQGSLGRSAEFRYMLTQLPVRAQTRLYTYFSDPFVRRLVGPEVKLSQARRLRARAAMELIASQRMFAHLNGFKLDSVEDLKRLAYLPKDFSTDDYSFDEQGLVHSKSYGPLPGMKTLPEVPIDAVTPAEAEAYREYVENYSRFWRQFFDPIAIRLDDTADGSLQLSTFILPLIDSSIYNGLRSVLMTSEMGHPLTIPKLEPRPVLQFSANMRDESTQGIVREFAGMFQRFGGVSSALLDDLGPTAHFAIFDADPVIALGSGDMMGAFGGNLLRAGDEMIMLPVAMSLLTRPCSILVETQNAEQTARHLRQAALVGSALSEANDGFFRVAFYQIDDRDSWVWTVDIEGVIKLRFGIEVTDRYLVIRNIPWSSKDRIVQVTDADLNGAALQLSPAACRLQLPGLFASASDQERRSTLSGMGRLYPIVLSGLADADSAAEYHQQVFGFRPIHPDNGRWIWKDFNLGSTVYGDVQRQRQPGFEPGKPFGLMQNIEVIDLQMQFEDAGLRSRITWEFNQN